MLCELHPSSSQFTTETHSAPGTAAALQDHLPQSPAAKRITDQYPHTGGAPDQAAAAGNPGDLAGGPGYMMGRAQQRRADVLQTWQDLEAVTEAPSFRNTDIGRAFRELQQGAAWGAHPNEFLFPEERVARTVYTAWKVAQAAVRQAHPAFWRERRLQELAAIHPAFLTAEEHALLATRTPSEVTADQPQAATAPPKAGGHPYGYAAMDHFASLREERTGRRLGFLETLPLAPKAYRQRVDTILNDSEAATDFFPRLQDNNFGRGPIVQGVVSSPERAIEPTWRQELATALSEVALKKQVLDENRPWRNFEDAHETQLLTPEVHTSPKMPWFKRLLGRRAVQAQEQLPDWGSTSALIEVQVGDTFSDLRARYSLTREQLRYLQQIALATGAARERLDIGHRRTVHLQYRPIHLTAAQLRELHRRGA